jgi:hypothetical protein
MEGMVIQIRQKNTIRKNRSVGKDKSQKTRNKDKETQKEVFQVCFIIYFHKNWTSENYSKSVKLVSSINFKRIRFA